MSKQTTVERFLETSRAYSDAYAAMHEAIVRKAGLTSADHKYLGLILREKEMTAGELATLTGLTTGAVTGLIDRLEKKKLVKRRFVKDDRRKVIIVANEREAAKLLKPLFAAVQAKTLKLIGTYSRKELELIGSYFTNAVDIMQEVTQKLGK